MAADKKVLGLAIDTQGRRRGLVVASYGFLLAVMTLAWIVSRSVSSVTVWTVYATIAVNALALGGYSTFTRHGLVKPFANKPPREQTLQNELLGLKLEELTHLQIMRRTDEDSWKNDERELARRDAVHYRAYQVLVLAMAVIMLIAEWSLHRPAWLSAAILPVLLYAIALPSVLMAVTLPQAIVLWTEPDLPESDSPEEGMPVITSFSIAKADFDMQHRA